MGVFFFISSPNINFFLVFKAIPVHSHFRAKTFSIRASNIMYKWLSHEHMCSHNIAEKLAVRC